MPNNDIFFSYFVYRVGPDSYSLQEFTLTHKNLKKLVLFFH